MVSIMNKTLTIFFILFLFSLHAHSYTKTIKLAADEWAPYNITPNTHCEEDTSRLCEGYMVDIARAIFEKNGYKLEYHILPWKRAISETMKGKYHGLVGADIHDGEGFIFPKSEMSINRLAFYVHRNSQWVFQNQNSLQTVSLGVIQGYGYRKWLKQYINENNGNISKIQQVTGNNPMQTNLKKLIHKRIDAIVDSEATIRYVAKQMGYLNKIKPAGYGIIAKNIYIVFSPADPNAHQYAKMLSDGIEELRQSGELVKIMSYYGLKDWKQ